MRKLRAPDLERLLRLDELALRALARGEDALGVADGNRAEQLFFVVAYGHLP